MSRRNQSAAFQPYEKESTFRDKCTTALCFSWKVFTCVFSHVTLVTLVVCYCIIGAFTFENLEAENEKSVKKTITELRKNVTENIWLMTYGKDYLRSEEWTFDAMNHLQIFEARIVTAMKFDGWDGSDDDNKLQWTFSGALFYSIIVITTIGYGHIAPKTQFGKVTTIFYAILGIPLMLLCLSNIGDIMASSFRFLYWRVCCYACTRETKQSRRLRGRTGTIRQRNSARSQLSPTARSIRNSQKSADSGIDPYDAQINHSYSDTELRYNSLSDTQYEMDYRPGRSRERPYNTSGKSQQSPRYESERYRERERPISDRERYQPGSSRYSRPDETETYIQRKHGGSARGRLNDRNEPASTHSRNFRNSRFSKYSDISPAARSSSVPRTSGNRASSLDPKTRTPAEIHMEKEDFRKTPVLCNKYAFEIIDDPKSKKMLSDSNRSNSLPRHQHNTRKNELLEPPSPPMNRPYYIDIDDEIDTPPVRRSKRREKPEQSSARIMSPMGFVVHRQARHVSSYRDNESMDEDWDPAQELPPKARPVPIWLCVCLVVGYIIAGAFLFSSWENWTFLDSAYFCFITLTTIGFGDFVPAQRIEQNAEVSIALCSIYLLFGIALLAMSFNLVQEEVIANVKSVARRLGILKEEEIED